MLDEVTASRLRQLAQNLHNQLSPYGYLTRLKNDEDALKQVLEDALELANHTLRRVPTIDTQGTTDYLNQAFFECWADHDSQRIIIDATCSGSGERPDDNSAGYVTQGLDGRWCYEDSNSSFKSKKTGRVGLRQIRMALIKLSNVGWNDFTMPAYVTD